MNVKKGKRWYVYLLRRISDGKMFVACGNFKNVCYQPLYVYGFVSEGKRGAWETPWGFVNNVRDETAVDCYRSINSSKAAYKVVFQYERSFK